jgi:ElaB/YqjD/DUF883 family membrane-anchored ribosome-binding protein
MRNAATKEARTVDGLAHHDGTCAKNCVDAGVKALDAVTGTARQIGRNVDGQVRANPWLAVGAAAGVGLVAGYLLRSRRVS